MSFAVVSLRVIQKKRADRSTKETTMTVSKTKTALAFCLALAVGVGATLGAVAAPAEWAMNATIIEACSCPMFCPCYFHTQPAAHEEEGHGSHGSHGKKHFCRFNMAYQVNRGHAGDVKLDGARFWIAGDLGDDFGDGETEWASVHFDPKVTPEQRQAIATVLGHVYPVKWKSFGIGEDAKIEWTATRDRAEARLGGGKLAEVVLNRNPGMTADPVVIENLRYFGAPRNDGFVLMPNEVEAYRVGPNAFEFKGSNGFMITYDIKSSDVAPAASGT
jgi:hypothetical protein